MFLGFFPPNPTLGHVEVLLVFHQLHYHQDHHPGPFYKQVDTEERKSKPNKDGHINVYFYFLSSLP